jgi:hypothetical protein
LTHAPIIRYVDSSAKIDVDLSQAVVVPQEVTAFATKVGAG